MEKIKIFQFVILLINQLIEFIRGGSDESRKNK